MDHDIQEDIEWLTSLREGLRIAKLHGQAVVLKPLGQATSKSDGW